MPRYIGEARDGEHPVVSFDPDERKPYPLYPSFAAFFEDYVNLRPAESALARILPPRRASCQLAMWRLGALVPKVSLGTQFPEAPASRDWRTLAARLRPPHPQPLSLKGRGEEE